MTPHTTSPTFRLADYPTLVPVPTSFVANIQPTIRTNLTAIPVTSDSFHLGSDTNDMFKMSLVSEPLAIEGPSLTSTQALDMAKSKVKIGQGGQGSVYKARLPEGQSIALKIANKPGPKIESRILEVLGRHPNIIGYHGFDTDQRGHERLRIEYIPGALDLRHIIARSDALDPKMVLDICLTVCSALTYINSVTHRGQEAKIVHGDIKPANLLITPEGQVKLIDFGVATTLQIRERLRRKEKDPWATWAYMDPHYTVYREPIGTGYDIHSLLVTTIEAILGSRASEMLTPYNMPHTIPESYHNAVDSLLDRLSKHLSLFWGKSHQTFIDKLIKVLRFNLTLHSYGKSPHRMGARELVGALSPLGQIAPGRSLREFMIDASNQGRFSKSFLDEQETLLLQDVTTETHSDSQSVGLTFFEETKMVPALETLDQYR